MTIAAQTALTQLEIATSGVATLTLNRPQARNALSLAMIAQLSAGFGCLGADSAVRVIILAASGPVFCSGHDLKELTAARTNTDQGHAFFDETMRQCSLLMQAIVATPKPVIAAVEGAATAAGCQLVASCDLAIAGEKAQFCTPGVNIGLFCSTPMVALSRNLSRKHAMEMLLTGDMVSAEDALRFGLINAIAKPGEALADAKALATKIASKSSMTLRTGKRAFYEQMEMGLAQAYDYAANVMVENMLAQDACEGISAFVEKREAKWQDQ